MADLVQQENSMIRSYVISNEEGTLKIEYSKYAHEKMYLTLIRCDIDGKETNFWDNDLYIIKCLEYAVADKKQLKILLSEYLDEISKEILDNIDEFQEMAKFFLDNVYNKIFE